MKKKAKKGKAKRKWQARPSTPLKPFKPEVPLSEGLLKKIGDALVHTNKTFKEIGAELNLDPDIVGEVCAVKNFRTPEEHREIAFQRAAETRRERHRAKKVKRSKIKAGRPALKKGRAGQAERFLLKELTETRKWFKKNYRRLPDFAFHQTSLADARKMVKAFNEKGKYGRFWGHFFYAGKEARQFSSRGFFNALFYTVVGLVPVKGEPKGAMVLVTLKRPIIEKRPLKAEKLAVGRDPNASQVDSVHVLSFTRKEEAALRKMFGELDSKFALSAFDYAYRRALLQKMIKVFEGEMKES